MIIASHESINGDYDKLNKIFKSKSTKTSSKEQTEYINEFCTDKLKETLLK